MDRSEVELGNRTWTEVSASDNAPVLLVPVGATEQHGPHLPIGTDTFIAETLCRRAASRIRGTLVTPPLTITASGEHQGFPGTLSIGTTAMTAVLVELVRSADWSGGVVLVNGHGGNHGAVISAVQEVTAEGRRVHAWWPQVAGADLHAGRTETAIMLAIHPMLVRLDQAVAGPQPTVDELRSDGVAVHSPTGVLGDPAGASPAAGHQLLDELVEDLVGTVARLASEWATQNQ